MNAETTMDQPARQAEATESVCEYDLLQALMEHSEDCIYFKDRQCRFIKNSRVHANCLGAKNPDEMVGKTDFDFFTEEHARPAFEDEQEIIHTGKPILAKTEKETRPDGRVTWALTSKMPFRNAQGEIIGTFGISKDITAMKEAEAKLEVTRRQLIDASRQAGMAEVATSVLHNVGNALNSINISFDVLMTQVNESPAADASKIAELLEQHRGDLPQFLGQENRGEQLILYLKKLAEQLAAEQSAAAKELKVLGKNVDHIKDIVSMQQNYAKVSGVAETVKITDLAEDALAMHARALIRHDVKLIREFAPNLPEITVEKHKVLQILVNLIHNAKYACDESGKPEKRLTVRVSNGGDYARITVADNGVGIPSENLEKIFSYGFTTRKDGHGFGLHSAALAARELNGNLLAQSEGPGQGATFTLELPLKPNGPTP